MSTVLAVSRQRIYEISCLKFFFIYFLYAYVLKNYQVMNQNANNNNR